MGTERRYASADATVLAVLRGGPDDIPDQRRICRTPADNDKIKLVHRGGYEHFEREVTERAEPDAVVFRWTTRTRIAE
jgi:hypothetical protein